MVYSEGSYFGVRAITRKRKTKVGDSGPRISILSPNYARLQFQSMLQMLNSSTARVPHWLDESNWEWQTIDTTEAQQELRRLIAAWNKSGPNLQKLFRQHPDLQASCSNGRTLLIPTRDGVAQLAWLPHPTEHKNIRQMDAALTQFIQFLVNPLAPKLGGPCERCGKFYVKNTKRQKTYCSRSCGTFSTALLATQKRREAAYSKKLLTAQKKIGEWGPRTRMPWKKWVRAKTANEITEQWLTRAVNSGKLVPPS